MKDIKIRSFPDKNYKAVFIRSTSMTIRLLHDVNSDIPMSELDFPEFYDIKLTGKCEGKCPWCYMSSMPDNNHYEVIPNLLKLFGPMSQNQRPFQIAYGGGEPTSHPDFEEILRTTKNLDIVPNFTTNGSQSNITAKVLQAVEECSDGVAISCHPHLAKQWKRALQVYAELANTKINFHIIISTPESVDYFINIYEFYKGLIDYFVLLKFSPIGRAATMPFQEEIGQEATRKLFSFLKSHKEAIGTLSDIAFGAHYYPDLAKEENASIGASIYQPNMFSKYIDMKDMTIYSNSFETKPDNVFEFFRTKGIIYYD